MSTLPLWCCTNKGIPKRQSGSMSITSMHRENTATYFRISILCPHRLVYFWSVPVCWGRTSLNVRLTFLKLIWDCAVAVLTPTPFLRANVVGGTQQLSVGPNSRHVDGTVFAFDGTEWVAGTIAASVQVLPTRVAEGIIAHHTPFCGILLFTLGTFNFAHAAPRVLHANARGMFLIETIRAELVSTLFTESCRVLLLTLRKIRVGHK